jgi:Xaa-Pro dipeptidase
VTLAATLGPLFGAHVAYLQKGYEAAMSTHGFDAIILCGGSAHLKNRFDDQSWPLSPTPAFSHWCPLVEADAFLVIRPSTKPLLVRTVTDDFWETPALPESDHFWSAFDLVEVKPGLAGDALPGGRVAVITRDPGTSPPGAVNPPALITALDLLRTKKTSYEIQCLVEASFRAAKGHKHVAAVFQSGTPSELELHLAYLQASEQDDATAPYKNIVALGEHAAVLHYVAYERTHVDTDTSFLIDAGAKVLGYGSDITRTHVRGKSPAAKRFKELLKHMDALQQQICRAIRPHLSYEDLHDEAHRMLANSLRDTGIARGGTDELVARGITRALFPHGLGHSLGITVHDAGMKPRPPRPENRFLRNTSVIEVGQVFTIEPGVYIIDALLGPLQADDRRELIDWSAIADLRQFGGIRIEDNILVEPGGIRNLTREAFAA